VGGSLSRLGFPVALPATVIFFSRSKGPGFPNLSPLFCSFSHYCRNNCGSFECGEFCLTFKCFLCSFFFFTGHQVHSVDSWQCNVVFQDVFLTRSLVFFFYFLNLQQLFTPLIPPPPLPPLWCQVDPFCFPCAAFGTSPPPPYISGLPHSFFFPGLWAQLD